MSLYASSTIDKNNSTGTIPELYRNFTATTNSTKEKYYDNRDNYKKNLTSARYCL